MSTRSWSIPRSASKPWARLCLTAAAVLLPWSAACAEAVAIIVHKDNPVENLSLSDLQRIFRQERQYWEFGSRIYPILQGSGSPEKRLVLRVVYRMEEEELRNFWLGKLYRAEIGAFPTTVRSNEAVKRFVGQIPAAIGYIDASLVDDSVRVVRIDGKLPGDPGYALEDSDGAGGDVRRGAASSRLATLALLAWHAPPRSP